jgi:hypothetical protein
MRSTTASIKLGDIQSGFERHGEKLIAIDLQVG